MKSFVTALFALGLSLSLSSMAQAGSLASACASFQMQLSKMDAETRRIVMQ